MKRIVRERNSSRTILILIFVLVSVFCILFFADKGRFKIPVSNKILMTLVVPFQRAFSWASSSIDFIIDETNLIINVHEENSRLRAEVAALRKKNIRAEEYAEENIRLRTLLAYKNQTPQYEMKMARVIGREVTSWTNTIIIDRGTNEGLKVNMPVVTDLGLVGCIIEVAPFSAKVELITDVRVAVGALVQRSRLAGIVEGSLKDSSHLRIVNIPRAADILVGDTIITSGFGGIYPKGITIGHVKEVKNDEGGLLKYGVIVPATDFQKLEDVAVIMTAVSLPESSSGGNEK